MAFIHGKATAVTLDGKDLSAYSNNVAFNRSADSHDVTTFGNDSKVYAGGLLDGTATISGIYDDTASTGPGAVIRPLLGTVVPLVYMPEGDAAGKPTFTVNALVTGYEETAPVADMVTWTCSLQFSGDVTEGTVSS